MDVFGSVHAYCMTQSRSQYRGVDVFAEPTNMWVCSPGLSAKLNKSLGKLNGLLVVRCRETGHNTPAAADKSSIACDIVNYSDLVHPSKTMNKP